MKTGTNFAIQNATCICITIGAVQVPLKKMEEKAMKTRTLALVAGMVLVVASAGFLQAAELNKEADMNAALSSNAANGVPDIISQLMSQTINR